MTKSERNLNFLTRHTTGTPRLNCQSKVSFQRWGRVHDSSGCNHWQDDLRLSKLGFIRAQSTQFSSPPSPFLYVTCSHEMIVKLCHAVSSISLKTVVGVNLGEIEIFALCRSSFIFTPYTCSFLLYSTHKCFKFCKRLTYWSIRHWEMTPKWPIFTEGLLSITRAEPHVSHTTTKAKISRCELLTWLFEIIQQKGAFEQSLV